MSKAQKTTGGAGGLDKERKAALLSFSKACRVHFHRLDTLNLAFTHRSVTNEERQAGGRYPKDAANSTAAPVSTAAPDAVNNERLEFLGDAILGAVTADLLYNTKPAKAEGEMAKIKSVVVSEERLAGIARELQIDTLLLLGRGEERTGGRTKKAILADALEALIGALYIDAGYKAAAAFVTRLVSAEIEAVSEADFVSDYKSLLQVYCQQNWQCRPIYRLLKRSGPDHDRCFCVEAQVKEQVYGPATGHNKKSAEQEAARLACEALGVR